MIRELPTLGEKFDLVTMLAPLVFAALVTGMLFLTQSISEWFNDRNL